MTWFSFKKLRPPELGTPAACRSDFQRFERKSFFGAGYAAGSATDTSTGIVHEHEHAGGIFFINFFEAQNFAGAGFVTATTAKAFFVIDFFNESGGPGTSVFGFTSVVSHR
jgi:hypothetical protein